MSRLIPFPGRPEVEWLGGRYRLPHRVRDGELAFQPDVILWLELPRRALVGSTVVSPDEPVSLPQSLEAAMRRPADGSPRRPTRIRVADRRTADELGPAAAGIPIAVAPVPELDAAFEELLFDGYEPEAVKPARPMGRNDPCPCGSGKKYKKCHLDADQAPRRVASELETVHDMDFRIVQTMARVASDGFSFEWFGIDPDDEPRDAMELLLPWAAWTAEANGRTVAASFLEQYASRLSPEERDWIAAQQAAWLSIWEVTAVAPGRVDVRDLLTGQSHSVREELGSRTLRARDTLLARVIDYRGASYFGGMYSRALPPSAAASVIDAVRKKLRLRKAPVPAERLRGRKIGWFLIDHWSAAVERGSLPPLLQNVDGDPLQIITDRFRFDAARRAEVEERLEAMADFVSASDEGGERVHVFMRAADDTVIGVVGVGDGMLRIGTNSENRADALARRVEEACPGMLQRLPRAIDTLPVPGDLSGEPPQDNDPEEQALLREVKETHYRKWLDTPLPRLGGKTPRAATRSVKSRRQLDLILRDLENLESRLPEAERFDVTHLRRELGLEP